MANPGKLLIVDDDLEMCRLLSLSLSPLGCEIALANDGYQALEWIEVEQFDAAILDLMLPGPGGIGILKHIREQGSEMEVIVLTAHASMETAIEAVRLGAYSYLTKPFNIDVIRSTVRQVLEKRRMAARLTAIHDLSREMALLLDVDQVIEAVLDIAGQVLEFGVCGLWLIDEERNELYPPGRVQGIKSEVVSGLSLDDERRITAAAARSGESLYVADVQEDPRYVAMGAANRSELAVPLKVKDRVIGVLNVESAKVDAFGPKDEQLLSTLAAQAAVAIENAKLYEQVRNGRKQLQALSHRLVEVQEAERAHIARELHDETSQALSSLLLGLSLLEQEVDDPVTVITHINELESMVDKMLKNLHRLAMNLRPATLDHLGLVPALEHYIESLGSRHDVTMQFEVVGLKDERLTPVIETAMYRIVQEALTNVIRHAQATHVDVLLERRGDQVVTIVKDDGTGFDPQVITQANHLGLFGMRERAEMLDGRLAIESDARTGTTVLVEVPYVCPDEEPS
jgi:signal transduction histidine kinase